MKAFLLFAPFRRVFLTLFCFYLLALGASSAFSRQASGTHPTPPAPQPAPSPKPPPVFPSATNPWDQHQLIDGNGNEVVSPPPAPRDSCFLPPLSGLPRSTVAVADLQITPKAQKEKEDACAAMQSSKVAEAEAHLRKAVKQSPQYSSAWVVLGQLLEAQQKMNDASAACSQPLITDSNYLPAYLCLADISAHSDDWNKVLQLSSRAIEIDSTKDPVAYDYNAAAYFHLHNLPAAEKSARRALEIDKTNSDPRVHFIMAQIYEAKGDRKNEAAELREYLKYATDPNDVAIINGYLSQLDGSPKN
jgi:Tetratricopeptide repeat